MESSEIEGQRPPRFSLRFSRAFYGKPNVADLEEHLLIRRRWADTISVEEDGSRSAEFNMEFFVPKGCRISAVDMRKFKADYNLFCTHLSTLMSELSFEQSGAAKTMYNIMTRRSTKENSFQVWYSPRVHST